MYLCLRIYPWNIFSGRLMANLILDFGSIHPPCRQHNGSPDMAQPTEKAIN